jgi:hypothetical protein
MGVMRFDLDRAQELYAALAPLVEEKAAGLPPVGRRAAS